MSWLGRELENCEIEESATLDSKVTIRGRKTGDPRPQLRRSNWICLNGEWRFADDDGGRSVQPIDCFLENASMSQPPQATINLQSPTTNACNSKAFTQSAKASAGT